MADVTKRLLTDETGQDIVTALGALTNVVDPNGTTVAAAQKLNNMTTFVTILAAGATPTSSLTEVDGHFHLQLGIPLQVPTVDSNDDGKFLMVEDGAWSPVSLGEGSGLMTDEEKEKLDNLGEIDIYKTTGSASIVSFPDGADDMPLKNLSVAIEPVQDLHGYDHPWPSGGGKNLVNASDTNVASQKTIATVTVNSGTYSFSAKVKNNTSVSGTIKFRINSTDASTGNISANMNAVIKIENVSVSSNNSEIQIVVSGTASGYNYDISNIQIELGSTATDYEPYSNICPITGWTGAKVTRTGINIWDEEWELGSIAIDSGRNTTATDRIRSKNKTTCSPNTSYYLGNYVGSIFWYGRDGSYIGFDYNNASNLIRTSPANAYWFKLAMKSSYGATYNHDISINYPATDTEYHAYQGNTYDITFPSDTGTVYGGTLDVTAGTLTVESVFHEFDGTEDTSIIKQVGSTSGLVRLNLSAFGNNAVRNTQTASVVNENYLRSNMLVASTASAWASVQAGKFGVISETPWIKPREEVFADAEAVLTWMAGQKSAGTPLQVMLELATPITYQLTPQEIRTLLGQNAIWADTGDVYVEYPAETTGLINTYDKVKIDTIPTKVSQLQNDSGYINSNPEMTGATSENDGTSGLVPAPSAGEEDKFLSGDGTYKSGGLPMVILAYGHSTWQDFINAYKNNVIVYCRASSSANPATGSQTRLGFMAYVNDANNPSNVEFQYYRSMNPNNKTINQLSDQVYVYKLTSSGTWSVEVREASLTSIVFDASSGLTGTFDKTTGTLTIAAAT